MATLEEYSLIHDAIANLNGLRRDARNNAQGYVNSLAAGQTYAEVSNIIKQDAAIYAIRLQWMADIFSVNANKAKLTNGATQMGMPIQDLIDAYNEIKTVTDGLIAAAPASSDADITAAKNYILNNIASYVTIWQ